MKRFYRSFLIFLIILILPILACNYPTPDRPRRELSAEDLRATLAAQAAIPGQPAPSPTLPPPGELPPGTLPPAVSLTPPPPGSGFAPPSPTPGAPPDAFIYTIQSGDTVGALAARFEVEPEKITALEPLPQAGLLPPGLQVAIPNLLGSWNYSGQLMPDSAIVYSPATIGFNAEDYVSASDGFLSRYTEDVYGQRLNGGQILQRVAIENSVNPRMLLAFLEYRSGWVLGEPDRRTDTDYPLGFKAPGYRGLYRELILAANHLNMGFYGWRAGTLTELKFSSDEISRLDPELNAGTVALLHLLSLFYSPPGFSQIIDPQGGFLALYDRMFGDPWTRAAATGPLLPFGLTQPELVLPFAPGQRWSFTGGPHMAWISGTPRGGIDFAPVTGEAACQPSKAFALAAAPGLVTRSGVGVVAVDLDGDGNESTGWVLVYLHVAESGRVPTGTWVERDDPIGHPSCERGRATGTHVHIARKYNGEWLSAGEPIPLALSGWTVIVGQKDYTGLLVNGDRTVTSNPNGPSTSIIIREE